MVLQEAVGASTVRDIFTTAARLLQATPLRLAFAEGDG
jgi:hypothetical protein